MTSEWDGNVEDDEWTPLPSRSDKFMDSVGLWGGFAIAIIAYFVMLVLLT